MGLVSRSKKIKIKVTVQFEGPYWSAIFERKDSSQQAIVRQIFATEPTDQELYDFVSHYFYELKFKESIGTLELAINRNNGSPEEKTTKPKSKKRKRIKTKKSSKLKKRKKNTSPSVKKVRKTRKTRQR